MLPAHMPHVLPFLIHWAVTAFSLWLAARIFKGLHFDSGAALAWSALLLGLANAVVRPVLVVLTLPLTLLTFGLFLLVINALMLMLVSGLVRGFRIDRFRTAFFASVFIAVLSLVIGAVVSLDDPGAEIQMPKGTVWI